MSIKKLNDDMSIYICNHSHIYTFIMAYFNPQYKSPLSLKENQQTLVRCHNSSRSPEDN